MSAKDKVRSNKTALLAILCGDPRLILNKVYEKKLITHREYKNIKSIRDLEELVDALVDKMIDKGEGTCQAFLNLLQTDEQIVLTYPELKNIMNTSILSTPIQTSCSYNSGVNQNHQIGSPPSHVSMDAQRVNNSLQAILSSPGTLPSCEGERVYFDAEPNTQPSSSFDPADYYSLTHNPRGVCMVINNEVFLGTRLKRRAGAQEDTNALHTVFTRLGFTVVIHKDLTAEAMRSKIKALGTRNFLNDDALVVCMLSHGEKGIVFGTDEQPVSLQEITKPFKSGQAPTLAGKPKLFFIQACQGENYQRGSLLYPPLTREDEGDRPERKLPCMQARLDHFALSDGQARLDHFALRPGSLRHWERPNCPMENAGRIEGEKVTWDADFLLGMATVPDQMAFRNTTTGSIYIQELCRQLTRSAQSLENDDILTILTRVNREVSKGEYLNYKQMPEPKYTLTKNLVLKFV